MFTSSTKLKKETPFVHHFIFNNIHFWLLVTRRLWSNFLWAFKQDPSLSIGLSCKVHRQYQYSKYVQTSSEHAIRRCCWNVNMNPHKGTAFYKSALWEEIAKHSFKAHLCHFLYTFWSCFISCSPLIMSVSDLKFAGWIGRMFKNLWLYIQHHSLKKDITHFSPSWNQPKSLWAYGLWAIKQGFSCSNGSTTS